MFFCSLFHCVQQLASRVRINGLCSGLVWRQLKLLFEACGVFVGRSIPAHRRSFSGDAGPPLARVGDIPDPPEMKSYGHAHGFSSRSMINTPSRVMAVPTVPLPASGFSSHSAVDTTSRLTHKGAAVVHSGSQTSQVYSRSRRSKSLTQGEHEALPVTSSGRLENPSLTLPAPPPGTLRRSLSGILAQRKGYWQEEELPQQYTYKGPSHRTISRITNRQQHYQQQQSSSLGQEGWVGNGRGIPAGGDTWGTQWDHQQQQQQQHVSRTSGTMHRAASLRSLRSVGKGVDVFDGASIHSNDPLGEMQNLDMPTAVKYLSESDAHLQVVGAAFIQHQCYHSRDAKNQVRVLQGVPALVQLFSSDNQEVKRYATAATRNLIYESAENKVALIDAGGLTPLVSLLNEPDEELRKTITGVLWNLSSRDNLKEKLSREALPVLTQKVLIPLCRSIPLSPSERDIFNSTTGCLRNLSSVNERTRQKMREMPGLVDSLVTYIQQEEQADEKGLENSLCVMRNLSYQLYSELPPSVQLRLEGPSRASANREIETIGCFTLYSKKNVEHQQNLPTLSQPKGSEWLWHPKVVGLYKLILQNSDYSSCSREAAIGALQNITAGDARWASVLSMVIIEKERMLPVLLDRLDTNSDTELRPLSGLLRNLTRHATDKQHMAKNMVGLLVSKLPADGLQKTPSSDVVVNLCGALNHLVTCSSSAARDVCHFNGIPKLVGIKTSHDSSSGSQKAARAASTVLCNMFQYKKLHRDYRLKGFGKRDFADGSF
ncbi:plakophilin-3-like isoform X2 [Pelmatolapia mariae]|uniref:plakophilin-3-like isoform X2 n=1 Tax=Pelmatolapia mariae TaxID=158779 RepID=UPI002FE547D8